MKIVVPDGFEDAITTKAEFDLPFWDRVKLLFGYRIFICVNHYCQTPPGDVVTQVTARAGDDWGNGRSVETKHGYEVVSDIRDSFGRKPVASK